MNKKFCCVKYTVYLQNVLGNKTYSRLLDSTSLACTMFDMIPYESDPDSNKP